MPQGTIVTEPRVITCRGEPVTLVVTTDQAAIDSLSADLSIMVAKQQSDLTEKVRYR